jgi:hypothetical protein
MKFVGHDLERQRSVRGQQLVADIHVEDLSIVCKICELGIDPFDCCANGIRRCRTAREDAKGENLCLGLAFAPRSLTSKQAADETGDGRFHTKDSRSEADR